MTRPNSSIGAALAQAAAATERLADAERRLAELLERLVAGDPVPPEQLADRAEILSRLPDLATIDPERREDFIFERDAALGRREQAARRIADLSAMTDLADVPLDLAECLRTEQELTENLAVRRRAGQILARARDRLVERVLPNTEINLRLLLPHLTAGRYHDARIGDDYRIEVWDEAAGRYVVKQMFSGGTKDQFSLCLRLAFALATLPQELGTAPGFLFLDEPLGSFDAQRAGALIDLLTHGQIAANFSQIFVITHVHGYDLRTFSHLVRLAEGRVVETNLPPPAASAFQPALLASAPALVEG